MLACAHGRASQRYVRFVPIGCLPGSTAGACAVSTAVQGGDPPGHGDGGDAAGAAGRGGLWRPGAGDVAVGAVLLAGLVAFPSL